MPLAKLGILDLSFVTDTLTQLLTDCVDAWPMWTSAGGGIDKFTIQVTGAPPDTVRNMDQCQLSLYLFHVATDPYQRNSPVVGARAQPIPEQPLSLNLYYLLSAYSKADYHQEQQAMSIAMRCFHQHPIVRANVPIPVPPTQSQPEEFTLTLEPETIDSVSRLWQSVTVPMRLAAVYKASVVFVTPPVPANAPARGVRQINLAADPAALPFAAGGQLIGTYRKVSYTSPFSSALASYDSSSATVAAGQTLTLFGAGLSDGAGKPNPTAKRLYLLTSTGVTQEVTGWIVPDPNPHAPPLTIVLDSRLSLKLPAAPPDPGVYQLQVGSDTLAGDATTHRSNAVPLCIAPAVTGLPLPPAPPILATGSFQGVGFLTGKTEVLLGTTPLQEGPAGPGNFQITGGDTINFQAPADLPSGLHALRVRVNQVEADPSWWVAIP